MKSAIKDQVKGGFDPLVSFLTASRIHPNLLTALGLAFGIVAGFTAATGHIREAALWLLVSGFFDVVDGSVARKANLVSKAGAFLDSTLDRYSEAAFFAGLMWHYVQRGDSEWTLLAIALFVAGSFLVSYVRARGEALGASCNVGLMERPERLVSTIVACLIAGPLLPPFLWILTILTHVTVLQRIWHVYGQLRS